MKLLITDSLFIFPEHEQQLIDAGFEIERLEKSMATEDELINALADKDAYILGGIESVTDRVLESTEKLKMISFTGTDWRLFIPGYKTAQKRGITITNAPAANAFAVAEYTITAILSSLRNFTELTRTGNKSFITTPSLQNKTIGIVGMGNIGEQVARLLAPFGVKIVYWNRTRKEDIENELGLKNLELSALFKTSDIITIHLGKSVGIDFITQKELSLMKDGALLVNCAFKGLINEDDWLVELQNARLKGFQDDAPGEAYAGLPISVWNHSHNSTAYNTYEANKKASDMATKSLINILKNGDDEYMVL